MMEHARAEVRGATVRSTHVPALLAATLLVAGCGGPGRQTHAATHEEFSAIQRLEEAIDLTRTTVDEDGAPCDAVCHAATRGCVAARGICAVAATTADLDARERCRGGRDSCRAMAARAAHRCRCAANHPPERPR